MSDWVTKNGKEEFDLDKIEVLNENGIENHGAKKKSKKNPKNYPLFNPKILPLPSFNLGRVHYAPTNHLSATL